MKKIFLAITIALCLALSLVALTSCSGSGDDCDHVWANMATTDTAATCTTDGSKSIKCLDCGEKQADSVTVIPATGHEYTTDSFTEATCTTDGSETKICAVCADTVITTIPATGGHTWGDIPTIDIEATCTTNGQKSIKCNVCQQIKEGTVEVINAEHIWGIIATADVNPTCTTPGTKTIKCIFCNEKQAGTEEEIPATGHFDVPVIVAPTLFSEGLAEGNCSACNEALSYTLPKTEPTVYSSATHNAEIKEEWNVESILEGDKHFYPTEDDPDGKALYVEYSILWNPTLLGIRDGYGYMTSPRIEGHNDNDYDSPYWICLKDNERTAWSNFAGSFEPIVMNGDTPIYGPPMNAEALPKDQYPNFGDYGWHRVGLEMKQTDIVEGNTVKKILIVTLYIDGVKASSYDMGIRYDHNWLYHAELVDGEPMYMDIALSTSIIPYYIPNLKPESGAAATYFVVADVSVSCGDGFVMNVTPVENPEDATYTIVDGVEVPGNVFFALSTAE